MKDISNDELLSELESIKDLMERRNLILNDVESRENRFKLLAKTYPYKFFTLLGGDISKIITTNWAPAYTYEEFLDQNGEEYNSEDAKKWDLEKESIERAHVSGIWHVIGTCYLDCPNQKQLTFEFDYCDGYIDGISATPYSSKNKMNNSKFQFD